MAGVPAPSDSSGARSLLPSDRPGDRPARRRTAYRLAVAVLLAAHCGLAVGGLQNLSITYDEAHHYGYGWQIAQGNARRFGGSQMPFSALNALPRKVATVLPPGRVRERLWKLESGRYLTVAASAVFATFVLKWATALYGPVAGLLSLFLYAFDPNVIAHAQLVTVDVYAAGMVLITMYTFWRFLNRGGWRCTAASAVAFGLAQLAKYTSAYLAPILVIAAIGHASPALWTLTRQGRLLALGRRVARFAVLGLVFLAVSALIINVGFLGFHTFVPLGSYTFAAPEFRAVQSALAPLGRLPVPVPAPYVRGLDIVYGAERLGAWNMYLLGQLGKDGVPGRPFPEYYPVVWLYKVPIAAQLLFLAAIVAYLRRWRRFDFRRNEWILLCPLLFFVPYFIWIFRTQLGIRYTLMLFPLIYVFTGSLLAPPLARARWRTAALAALVAYQVASVASYYPHFLPYFNELVWDRRQAYKILADSNLDWGQSTAISRSVAQGAPRGHLSPR